ncbi:MAG TPA: hypothetical protein V6D10_21440 [Trichocoleus sp.]|jgi:hypothetical protein
MKLSRFVALLLVGAMLSALSACVKTNPPVSSNPSPADQASGQSPNAASATVPSPSPEERPDTRIMPINVEGRATEVELKLLDQSTLPFTTYFPSQDFVSQPLTTQAGSGVRLYFSPGGKKNAKAYIDLFIPDQASNLEEMQDLILGDRGLLVTNRWELVDRTDIVSYPWVKEKLIYQQATSQETIVGAIYTGEYKGKAFYMLTHYPEKYSDRFSPRSTIVLENVQFREEK